MSSGAPPHDEGAPRFAAVAPVPTAAATWGLRRMRADDLAELLVVQERGAVAGLCEVFPQETHPFPADTVRDRWRAELRDPAVAAYVATDGDGRIVGFAARRGPEILHFGTAVETWGSGLATWLHDALLLTYPSAVDRLVLCVFAGNARGRRFYEKLGWRATGVESRTSFPPHPVLLEYALDRRAPG